MRIYNLLEFFEKNNWITWTCVLIIAIYIFYISSLTFPPSTQTFSLKAPIYHIGVFFIFSLIIALVKKTKMRYFIIALLISIGYSVSDELHQTFVPGRYGSLGDVFLDIVGVSLAFLTYSITIAYRRSK